MPTNITRDGQSYTEYNPTELDELRLERDIDDMIRRGRYKNVTESKHVPSYGSNGKRKHKGFSIDL